MAKKVSNIQNDKVTLANRRVKDEGFIQDETEPAAVPHPTDPKLILERKAEEVRHKPVWQPLRKVNAQTMPMVSQTNDKEVGHEEWKLIAALYAQTGHRGKLSELSGVSRTHISHLLHYGVRRLGLPPIKEYLVDRMKVNLRLHKEEQEKEEEAFLTHLPELQKAITKRAEREAASAQAALQAVLKTNDVVLGLVQNIAGKVEDEGIEAYELPQKLTGPYLEKLTATVDKLAAATDKAVRLSRLTAGEPEHNVAMHVAHLVTMLGPDELREYGRTGELPTRLRTGSGVGAAFAALSEKTALNLQDSTVIDIEAEAEAEAEEDSNPVEADDGPDA